MNAAVDVVAFTTVTINTLYINDYESVLAS